MPCASGAPPSVLWLPVLRLSQERATDEAVLRGFPPPPARCHAGAPGALAAGMAGGLVGSQDTQPPIKNLL